MTLTACGSGETENAGESVTLTVSAAASLTDALEEAAALFSEEHPDIKVDFNFGGSGALQQQISQGAPADIFFSASKNDFDALIESGSIAKEQSVNLLQNELVLVTPADNQAVTSFDNIQEASQIAVGTPESVPAGKYSMETFESFGITADVEPLLVYAEDVRAVLTYVERDEVDAGLVYRTDALTSDSVEIADTAPKGAHDPIVYPVGIIKKSDNAEAAEIFYDFLQTEDTLAVFEEYGFTVE
ncbi:molybdate transport system substrate-binding protein [Jeotgalicoccus coquinae]|nr:molybdate ABC transporter substrate-binding protein [Jeotgalicoccus coquinae]MBB6423696.1 molybdate transport system substrate-binding protein [Jeotgalicoccus coquinae]